MSTLPRLAALAVAALAPLGACDLPRDPEGTLERVQGKELRVGLVEQPPWVDGGERPAGREAELAGGFARALGARILWTVGGESELLQALADFELDLVIGGLDADTPWSDRVALTQPHLTQRVVVGLPAHVAQPAGLSGLRVAVPQGSPMALLARRHGALAEEHSEPLASGLPVVAPEWRLAALGLRPSGLVLRQRDLVMAVPPGENGFLMRLERFLAQARQEPPHAAAGGA